jgi:hypothetical protein
VARLRAGEVVALAGALGLLVTLFLTWFAAAAPAAPLERSGWSGVGWLLAALLAVLVAAGLAVAAACVTAHAPAWSVGAAVFSITYGLVVALVLLVRLLTQPSLGVDAPNALVDVRPVAWLGLAFAAMVPVGGWIVLADERTGARESAYTPPPARPVPGT